MARAKEPVDQADDATAAEPQPVRRLAAYVHLYHPDNGERHVFAPGDIPPDWAVPMITAPRAWADDEA